MELLDRNPLIESKTEKTVDPVSFLLNNGEPFLAQSLVAARLQTNPKDAGEIFRLANIFLKRKEIENAEKCFFQLAQIEDSARAWAGLGDIYYSQERYDLAQEAYFDAVLRADDDRVLLFEVHKNIGNIYVRLNEYDLAEDFYNKAHTINPNSDVLAVNFATLALQRQDQGRAVLRFRQALQINSKNDKAWVGLAITHDQYGDKELAWANLRMALEKNPANKTALILMAQWSHRDGMHMLAISPLIDYLSDNDFDEQISTALVELLVQSGNYQMAKLEIERALAWVPENQHLAHLLKTLSLTDKNSGVLAHVN